MSQLGVWRSIPDRPEHFHHRIVTDAISDVSSNSSWMWEIGTWYVGFLNENWVLFLEKVKASFVSFLKVKYKEDLSWLRGIGCYVWDTPDFTLAGKNKVLYSGVSKTPWIVAEWFLFLCFSYILLFLRRIQFQPRHWYEFVMVELEKRSIISILGVKEKRGKMIFYRDHRG